jgi:hypothetical protein
MGDSEAPDVRVHRYSIKTTMLKVQQVRIHTIQTIIKIDHLPKGRAVSFLSWRAIRSVSHSKCNHRRNTSGKFDGRMYQFIFNGKLKLIIKYTSQLKEVDEFKFKLLAIQVSF